MDNPVSTDNVFSRFAPAAAALAITLSFLFVPVIGALIISFLPAPIAYARHRYGLTSSSMAAFISSAFAFSVSGSMALASIVMLYCVCGYVMGVSTASGEPADRAVLKASSVPLLLAIPAAGVYFFTAGINPLTLLDKWLNLSLQESISLYRQMGMTQADIDTLMPSLKLVVSVVKEFFPALLVWMMVASAVVSLAALNAFITKKGLPGVSQSGIKTWYAPDHAVWGIIVPGFLVIPDLQPLRAIAGNVLASVAIVYLFQGFAVVTHLFDRLRLGSFLRVLILALVMVQPLLILFMWAVGFFDTWADFRKIRPGTKTVE